MIHLEYSPRYVQQCRAETEKYLVRSEQLLFQGGYEYKCGGDTHINAGGIRISLSIDFGNAYHGNAFIDK